LVADDLPLLGLVEPVDAVVDGVEERRPRTSPSVTTSGPASTWRRTSSRIAWSASSFTCASRSGRDVTHEALQRRGVAGVGVVEPAHDARVADEAADRLGAGRGSRCARGGGRQLLSFLSWWV